MNTPQTPPMQRAKYSGWFLLVTASFVTVLITSNILAVKLIKIGPLDMDAGNIIFPISYIFGDILTEVYGYGRSRRVIWLGFLCNLFAVTAFAAAQRIPPAPFWEGQSAYETILGFTPRILVASFCAYLCGEFMNSYVLAKMKLMTKGKHLWTRTIGSTMAGQAVDSTIFVTVAFAGVYPASDLMGVVASQWLFKTGYEALMTPVTYKVVNFLKREEQLDHYDWNTNFNPLKLAETVAEAENRTEANSHQTPTVSAK